MPSRYASSITCLIPAREPARIAAVLRDSPSAILQLISPRYSGSEREWKFSIFLTPRPRPSGTSTGASSTVQRSSTSVAIDSTVCGAESLLSTSLVSCSTRPPYVKILNVDPGCRQPVAITSYLSWLKLTLPTSASTSPVKSTANAPARSCALSASVGWRATYVRSVMSTARSSTSCSASSRVIEIVNPPRVIGKRSL